MSKIKAGQAFDLIVASQLEAKVGDYKWSHLDEAAFAEEHLGTWFLCDGRSCIGTNFATITGQLTVPNAKAEGTFIRQAKDGRITGSYEADQFQGHKHDTNRQLLARAGVDSSFDARSSIASNDDAGYYGTLSALMLSPPTADGTNGTPRTGNETRSKNIALNLYVKVNN